MEVADTVGNSDCYPDTTVIARSRSKSGDVAIRSPKCYVLLKAIDKISFLEKTDCRTSVRAGSQ